VIGDKSRGEGGMRTDREKEGKSKYECVTMKDKDSIRREQGKKTKGPGP